MKAYSFERYCRDMTRYDRVERPLRVWRWLDGDETSLFLDGDRQVAADTRRMLNTLNASMTPAERADPSGMGISQRVELSAAAKVTEDELSFALHGYEMVQSRIQGPEMSWWLDVFLDFLKRVCGC